MNMILDHILTDKLVIIKVILYVCLIFISAFFAGIETALLKYTATKSQLKEQLKEFISFWEQQPERVLGTILIGTNLACIGVGVLTVSLKIWIWWSIIILLVAGEIIPKVYALFNPNIFIYYGIKKLVVFSRLISPVVKFLVNVSLYFTSIFLREQKESPFITKQELEEIITKEKQLEKDEKNIYKNMLEIAEKRVYEIMTPKEDVVCVDINWSLDEIMSRLSETKFSRIPVYNKNIDNIVGVIYTKDLIVAIQNKELLILNDLLREVYFVIDTARIIDVLKKFKQGQHHLAVVVNEYGATVGVVTIEDIIEEVVGEIYDEYDIIEQRIKRIDDHTIVVSGDESIKDIEQTLDIKLLDEEVATIGGYIATKIGYVPDIGEKFIFDNLSIEVLDASEKVVKKVKISKLT
ncbi:MAG: hemolysin family protein [Endomicrobia bacterium]|nr:hemolysin family protein [Endomicrobiia bacterium]MCX7716072.1 hemolysin family protein [Endomicrobiia bacterium]